MDVVILVFTTSDFASSRWDTIIIEGLMIYVFEERYLWVSSLKTGHTQLRDLEKLKVLSVHS